MDNASLFTKWPDTIIIWLNNKIAIFIYVAILIILDLYGFQIWPAAKWGFIDKNGVLVIPPKFEFALPFSEGLAIACHGDNRGFIDKKGEFVIPERFDYATSFSGGLSLVHTNREIGYINPKGKFVWKGPFSRTAAGLLMPS